MFNKKILVAGCGKSGLGAAALLARNNESVILFDENKKNRESDIMEKISCENKENIEVVLGELTDEIFEQCELMVISPGIPTDAAFVEAVRAKGIPIWSEIELAYSYEKGSVAAITGTNGKTTTTTLVGEIIKKHNENTVVVGNIGTPYTSLCDSTDENSITVAEISSFQLETIHTFKPKVSAILNITPDHIDRHHTFKNYASCKVDITKNQTENEVAVLNFDDPETKKRQGDIRARIVFFSRKTELDEGVFVQDEGIVVRESKNTEEIMKLSDIKLLGTHNLENVLAAVAISYYMGVPGNIIREVCSEFMGVEHRIEYVAEINGVKYYNDSKGTNPDAAIKAINAMTAKTYLIAGGYDKNSTYDEWIEAFGDKVQALVLIGKTAPKIALCAKEHGFNNIVMMDSLENAVKYCGKNAKSGELVLLSPACASWDMFKSYEERGKLFKEYVLNL